MIEIDTKVAYEFTKELSVLYVEDDSIVQKQTHKFLNLLFNAVEVANDGQEALMKYEQKKFDIVITDIVMPNMDGLELSKKIRELNPYQNIIVTSAYNDSDQLIEFINLHIRQFMLKPVEINNMLFTLYAVSKAIVNNKMVEEYKVQIEKNNLELKEKNEELKNIVEILNTKLTQLSKYDVNNHSDETPENIDEKHLDDLKELEKDISETIKLVNLSENINLTNIKVLSELFLEYANILSIYEEYTKLTSQIHSLVNVLKNEPQNFIKHISSTSILLESFTYVLKMWRSHLHNGNVEKAFKLHSSMINDISTIIAIIKGNTVDVDPYIYN